MHEDFAINTPGLLLRELCSLIEKHKVTLLTSSSHHFEQNLNRGRKITKEKIDVLETGDNTKSI